MKQTQYIGMFHAVGSLIPDRSERQGTNTLIGCSLPSLSNYLANLLVFAVSAGSEMSMSSSPDQYESETVSCRAVRCGVASMPTVCGSTF